MSTTKEKFLKLVAEKDATALAKTKERIANRAWLKESQEIALKVLEKLDNLGWSQRKLAQKMDVSPQQISKLVRGKENLTLATQQKLQEILDIPVLATYYEQKFEAVGVSFEEEFNIEMASNYTFSGSYESQGTELKMSSRISSKTYTNSLKIV